MEKAVDANVLLRGRGVPGEEKITVPDVVEELESQKGRNQFMLNEIDVYSPSDESVEEVSEKSREISSPTSEADERLLALALERGATLVTDDKYLQNLALHLGVDFESYMAEAVEETREWKMICPSCGRETEGRCSSCGAEATRKPR